MYPPNAIQNYTMKDRWDTYITSPQNCVTTLANKVIKCAPLITDLITIAGIFSLFHQIEARYLPYQQIQTSATTFILDDVKIVPIAKAVWIYKDKTMRFCSLSNPWCMRQYSLLSFRNKW